MTAPRDTLIATIGRDLQETAEADGKPLDADVVTERAERKADKIISRLQALSVVLDGVGITLEQLIEIYIEIIEVQRSLHDD